MIFVISNLRGDGVDYVSLKLNYQVSELDLVKDTAYLHVMLAETACPLPNFSLNRRPRIHVFSMVADRAKKSEYYVSFNKFIFTQMPVTKLAERARHDQNNNINNNNNTELMTYNSLESQ